MCRQSLSAFALPDPRARRRVSSGRQGIEKRLVDGKATLQLSYVEEYFALRVQRTPGRNRLPSRCERWKREEET
jgi:hypothetical protein